MATHLECIGFSGTREEGKQQLSRAYEAAIPMKDDLWQWFDPSGAAVHFHTDAEYDVKCFTPSFADSGMVRGRALDFVPDAECPFCSSQTIEVLEDDGSMVYPIVMQLEDPERQRLK